MSDEREQLRKAFKRLTKQPMQTIVGTVINVIEDDAENPYTCDVAPLDESPILYNVRLKSIVDDDVNGLIVIPENKSTVLVTLIGNDRNNCFVSNFSKVANVYLRGKDFGGLVKIEILKTEMEKLNANINVLKAACQAAFVPVDSLVSGACSSAFSTGTATMQQQDLSQLENENVKHG